MLNDVHEKLFEGTVSLGLERISLNHNNTIYIIAVYLNTGHINNLNNTCIWKLVQLKGLTTAEAQQCVNVSSCQGSFIVACKTDIQVVR